MIAFHLPIVPPTATSQGAGKRMMIITSKKTGKPMPLFFKNKQAAQAEDDFLLLCGQHRPAEPIAGPVALYVDYVWPWRASEPAWRRALGRVAHTSRPDCSNAVKQLEDVLTKLQFWRDDSQVSCITVSKAWGDQVGIYIRIDPLPEVGKPEKPPKIPKGKKPPTEQPSLF